VLAGIRESLGEHRVGHRSEQQGVGAGPDRHPLIGLFGGARQTRIDDDHLAATGLDRLDPTREVGSGAHAPVGGIRVGAEDHEVIGPIEVGNGDRHRRAEHVTRGDVPGHLVDRRGAEAVTRAEPGQQHP
jgi:hypothetical protein